MSLFILKPIMLTGRFVLEQAGNFDYLSNPLST